MKFFFGMILFFGLATTGLYADHSIVTESDTGVVFGDVDCANGEDSSSEFLLYRDVFDYLRGQVAITYTCTTRDGRQWQQTGYTQVWFPELDFNWGEQAWYHGEDLVAKWEGFRRIGLADGMSVNVWTDVQVDHIATKLQIVQDVPE